MKTLKKDKVLSFAFLFGILLFQVNANAVFAPVDMVGDALTNSATAIFTNLQATATGVLGALLVLQMVITGFGQLFSDFNLAKMFKVVVWAAVCMFILKVGPDFIKFVVNTFIATVASWSGAASFDTASIFKIGIDSYSAVLSGVATSTIQAAKDHPFDAALALFTPGVSLMTVLISLLSGLFVLVACGFIAIKVFMVKIEAVLIWGISPLSFSLLGLTALRDQGLAPFKSMLALVYRIVILGAVVAAMPQLSTILTGSFALSAGNVSDAITPVFAACFGYALLAYLAFKSDAIATSLASGSANLGAGDLAATAATAAAVVAGGAALGAAAFGGSSGAAATGASGGAITGEGTAGAGAGGSIGAGSGGTISSSAGGNGGIVGGSISPATTPKGKAASEAATLAGTPPEAAKAGIDAAGSDKSHADIASAVEQNGGTPEQAEVIASAGSQGGDLTPAQRRAALTAASASQSIPPPPPSESIVGDASEAGIAGATGGSPKSESSYSNGGSQVNRNSRSRMDHLSNAYQHGRAVTDQVQRADASTSVSISGHHHD